MSKKKPSNARGRQKNIIVGNVSDIDGTVNIAGGNITTHQTTTGLSAGEIKRLFDQVYIAIENKQNGSQLVKEDVKQAVQEIQSAVTTAAQKNEKVDEGFLSRHFRNLARMAPDVLDVVVATLANPLAGIGIAAKKIAEKAKEETG